MSENLLGRAADRQRPLSRQEAADYLRVSTRTLHRLRLPRSYVGARPIYLIEDLDAHLARTREVPAELEARTPVQKAPRRARVYRARRVEGEEDKIAAINMAGRKR